MNEIFSRTENLIGEENLNKLKNSRIAIFGLGGVGGHTFEALVRSGVGSFDLFDNDVISESNINRQILATRDTVGIYKTEAAKSRALLINNDVKIQTHNIFYTPDNADEYDFSKYDYIVDAIDTVTSKIELILRAKKSGVPIISSMGTGNKLNPAMLEVADIQKTSVCPLARVMRLELKKRGINKLKCVYSKEIPIKPQMQTDENGRHIPASSSFVPGTAGLIIAAEVVKDIIKKD